MLTATVELGTDCENDALIWQSSDESVVIVDDNGKITAIAAGNATIFAISEDSGMSAQCEVTVDYKDPCAALGHKMSTYVVTKKPTCTDKGTETSICSRCDKTETKSIAATGHNYKDNICVNCGNSKAQNCSHMCHKNGFMGFIWKIVRFFWKLFKMSPVCECGAKHY